MTTFTSWDTELYHHGILGMKWGVRRFQNKDGSLTPAGKKRVRDMSDDELRRGIDRANLEREYRKATRNPVLKKAADLADKYIAYKEAKEKKDAEKERNRLTELNYRTQRLQALYGYKKAKEEAIAAKASNIKNKKEYLEAKTRNTIRGALRKKLAEVLTRSKGDKENNKLKQSLEHLNLTKKISDLSYEVYGDPLAEKKAREKRGRNHTAKKRNRVYGLIGN